MREKEIKEFLKFQDDNNKQYLFIIEIHALITLANLNLLP